MKLQEIDVDRVTVSEIENRKKRIRTRLVRMLREIQESLTEVTRYA